METLFSRLGKDDARFYREVDEDLLFHQVEALSRSFKGKWTRAILEEVGTLAEGRLQEEESDNLM